MNRSIQIVCSPRGVVVAAALLASALVLPGCGKAPVPSSGSTRKG